MELDCNGCEALFEGIPKNCLPNRGGIRRAWFTEKCNVASVTLASPSQIISDLDVGSNSFYGFEFNKNSSTWTEVTTFDRPNGLKTVAQTVTLKIPRREKSKRDTLIILGLKELVCIIEDANGEFFYLGENDGLEMTENNSENGTAKTDFNGYTLTFVGEEPVEANTILESAVNDVIA